MGSARKGAIVGYAEWATERRYEGPRRFMLEQWMDLAAEALADAGLALGDVDGLVCGTLREANMFVPATVVEYLGQPVKFAEFVDLGGATGTGMLWRAAAAIELGLCDVVLCALPGLPIPSNPDPRDRPPPEARWLGSTSNAWGSPQAEFEVPFGNVAQNAGYAMIAAHYEARFGSCERARAQITAQQRASAALNPLASFYEKPVTIEEVLASPMIAEPLRLLEIVMPCAGGAAVVLASPERAKKSPHRPVQITGYGESLTIKTPTFAEDLAVTPVAAAAATAFARAGTTPAAMDLLALYDCYTITVLLTLEDAGFCPKGAGATFLAERNLAFDGDFPVNTHGGQLGVGQPGLAGGLLQPIEAARQLMGRAGPRQVRDVNRALVTGTGGVMSEQVALILEGA